MNFLNVLPIFFFFFFSFLICSIHIFFQRLFFISERARESERCGMGVKIHWSDNESEHRLEILIVYVPDASYNWQCKRQTVRKGNPHHRHSHIECLTV